MGEKLWKLQVFLSGINSSKRVVRTWKMMNKVVVQELTELMKMLKKMWNLVHSDRCLWIRTMVVQLNLDKKNGEKGLNFGSTIGFSNVMLLQLARCPL
jgi:hypothetical protein